MCVEMMKSKIWPMAKRSIAAVRYTIATLDLCKVSQGEERSLIGFLSPSTRRTRMDSRTKKRKRKIRGVRR
jgi:hypothetical protein